MAATLDVEINNIEWIKETTDCRVCHSCLEHIYSNMYSAWVDLTINKKSSWNELKISVCESCYQEHKIYNYG